MFTGSIDGDITAVFLCAFSYRRTGRGNIWTGLRLAGSSSGKEVSGGRDKKGLFIGRKESENG